MGKWDPKPPNPPIIKQCRITIDNVTDPQGVGISCHVKIGSLETDSNQYGYASLYPFDEGKTYTIEITSQGYDPYKGLVVAVYPETTFKYILNPIVQPIVYPTPDQCRAMKGDFCGISAAGLTKFNSPSPYVFTVAYGVYSISERATIRDRYKAKFGNWSTMPVAVRDGAIYSDDYPNLDESKDRQYLEELYRDQIIPLIPLLRDEDTKPDPNLPYDMIKMAFVKWEMNMADNNNTQRMVQECWDCRQIISHDCLLGVHFTDEHAAGIGDDPFWYCDNCGNPYFSQASGQCSNCHQNLNLRKVDSESACWQWYKKIGISFILYQDDREDNAAVIDRVGDFTIRFGTGLNGWPMGIGFYLFERGTESKYHGDSVDKWDTLNEGVMQNTYQGMQITGYCSGRKNI